MEVLAYDKHLLGFHVSVFSLYDCAGRQAVLAGMGAPKRSLTPSLAGGGLPRAYWAQRQASVSVELYRLRLVHSYFS